MNNNVSLGRIPCFLREEFCHNQKPIDKRIPGIIFGVESIPGCAFGFHVHREDGAVYCQIPIHGLCWKQDAPLRELSELQVWDCFGWNISVCKFDYLTQLGGIVRVGGQTLPCQYITTIDPYDDDYSSDPIQHKNFHFVMLGDGNFGLYPNNMILWIDKCWTEKVSWANAPILETNTLIWRCESQQ